MKLYRGFTDSKLKKRPRSIAIGIFDGVHRGHQAVLSAAVRDAKTHGTTATAVTFDPHPLKILKPSSAPKILQSLEHRLQFLQKIGIEETIIVRFSTKIAAISREAFLKKYLIDQLGMEFLATGYDFRFGHRGEGDSTYLRSMSKKLKFRWKTIPAFRLKSDAVSSTLIRNQVEAGHLREASRFLGRPYSVYGTVIEGRGRGKRVGYRTANLNPHHEALPPDGVYAAWAYVNTRRFRSVVHIGKRPTFGDRQKSLEVHFLDSQRNIYGEDMELVFVRLLRPIQKFKSVSALRQAIAGDIRNTAKVLALQTP